MRVDPPEEAAGSFLAQKQGDDVAIVAYFSQHFDYAGRYYSVTPKEWYAVVLGIQH